jgi:hypothetical protein
MEYQVSLQVVGAHWGFTRTFSQRERDDLLSARPDVCIAVREGDANLDAYGSMAFTLKSPGGQQYTAVSFKQLCYQLLNPESVEMYVPNSES